MDVLWSISGTRFLVAYGVALALALVAASIIRWRVRRPPASNPAEPLGVAELAYLTGGPRLTVAAVIAELVESGKARVSRGGSVMATSTASTDPIEAEVLRGVAGRPQLASTIVAEVADSSPVLAVRDRLVERGLMVAPATARAARLWAVAALYGLAVVALVRHVFAVRLGFPVGYLSVLILVNLVLAVTLQRRGVRLRTVRGDRLVASVRDRSVRDRSHLGPQLDPWLDAAVAGAGGRVAVEGMSAFPEATIRRELTGSAIMIGMVAGIGGGLSGSGMGH